MLLRFYNLPERLTLADSPLKKFRFGVSFLAYGQTEPSIGSDLRRSDCPACPVRLPAFRKLCGQTINAKNKTNFSSPSGKEAAREIRQPLFFIIQSFPR